MLQWKNLVSRSAVLLAAAISVPHSLVAQETDAEAGEAYASQTSAGEVTLSVTPVWEGDVLSFQISANTHSVDLGSLRFDELMTLVVGDTTWEPEDAGGLGGHHARTTVRFTLPSRPGSFVLEIRDVPDVPLRRLVWPEASGSPDG